MDKKIILITLGMAILGYAFFNPSIIGIMMQNTLLIGFVFVAAIAAYLIYKKLTEPLKKQTLKDVKTNIVNLCRQNNKKYGHLVTLGIGDVPTSDWGQITGIALGQKFKVDNKIKEWTVFILEKPNLIQRIFSEPVVVFIEKGEHLPLQEGQNVYIKAVSLVSYGNFMFANTAFGTSEPMAIIKEYAGMHMFCDTINQMGTIVDNALLANSQYQQMLEMDGLMKRLKGDVDNGNKKEI